MPDAGAASSAVHVMSARPGQAADAGPLRGLAEFLAVVPDHRSRRGRRHSLTSILSLACAATAAGAKSLVAIAEWAVGAPAVVPESPGCARTRAAGAGAAG